MLLNRLIKLYRSSNQLNTPLENFTTEALVGVFEGSTNLLDDFVNTTLEISGKGFKIKSQGSYLYCGTYKYIDVVIFNEYTICFIENKVDSDIREDQLKIYAEILEEISKKSEQKVFLRLCTRFIEGDYDKSFKSNIVDYETYFKHFRWNDIYQFLKKYEDNLLVKDFRQFLKSNGMGLETNLSIDDIKVFNNFQKIMPKFDEYRNLYTNSFKKYISEKFVNQDQYKRLLKNNEMIIYTENILGENAWSGIGTGIKIEDNTYFFIWIWLNNGNTKLKSLQEELRVIEDKSYSFGIHENGLTLRIPVEEFVSENPNAKVKKWFDENLLFVRKFIKNTPNLDWKINLPQLFE